MRNGTATTAGGQGERSRRIPLILAVVLAILLVANAALWFTSMSAWNENRGATISSAEERPGDPRQAQLFSEYRGFADRAGSAIAQIDGDKPEAFAERIKEFGAGAFLDDFKSRESAVVALLKKEKVQAKGRVLATGIEQVTEHQASVLVVITQKVSNASQPEEQESRMRLRMTIDRDDDGNMKVTNVTPVL